MSKKEKWSQEQLNDYTKFPNILIDKTMSLLTPEEWKVLSYIIRRTEGFHKGADTLSISQLTGGITKKDGSMLDGGVGMNVTAIWNALKHLQKANIIFRISTEGKESRFGLTRMRGQPFNGEMINWDWLKRRKKKWDESNKKRTARARERRAEKVKARKEDSSQCKFGGK